MTSRQTEPELGAVKVSVYSKAVTHSEEASGHVQLVNVGMKNSIHETDAG